MRYALLKKIAAIAFLTCFIVAPLLSGALILIHADHDHNHDEAAGSCGLCAHIQSAQNLLRQIGAAVKRVSFVFFDLFSVAAALYAISSFIGFQTPVDLKVRMND